MPLFFDRTMLLLIPAFILALYAQTKVKSTYAKYSKIPSSWGRPGYTLSESILHRNGIHDVEVEMTEGVLSDHYDPLSKKVRLSPHNYEQSSVAAVSVAAHETGHAIQHHTGYAPLVWRHQILPAVNLGSSLSIPLFFIGLIFSSPMLMDAGIILFSVVVLFQVITLPVEFNASARALQQLRAGGYLPAEEMEGAKKVLQAAALTYVAAATVSLMHLVRLLILRGERD
ncbi:MAG: zinc metallopeptidase [Calditrichaeota bacterium]|nr:zinc metallopeptidase [Calditrichota bacterium]